MPLPGALALCLVQWHASRVVGCAGQSLKLTPTRCAKQPKRARGEGNGVNSLLPSPLVLGPSRSPQDARSAQDAQGLERGRAQGR